jgi:hypothetical protein
LGRIKFHLESDIFRLRGSDKADGEWTLVCLVHNIGKICAKIVAGGELDNLTENYRSVYIVLNEVGYSSNLGVV